MAPILSTPTVAVMASPYNIQYLSFQGGGGKGLAYLGALQWLENYPENGTKTRPSPLPLYNGQPAGQSIIGVSGASAGAITALFVALGYTSNAIQSQLQAINLVDANQSGVYRSVPPNIVPQAPIEAGLGMVSGELSTLLSIISKVLQFKPVSQTLEPFLSQRTSGNINTTTYPVISNGNYTIDLGFDGGMLTGANLLSFIQNAIDGSPLMTGQTKTGVQASPTFNGKTMTFANLWMWNKNTVKLAISATNLTTGRPVVFSYFTTPNFPVADAVAISASFPFLFKPVWVSSQQDFGPAADKAVFTGWYADGGLTNNVPIHVFDDLAKGTIPADPTMAPSGPVSSTFSPGLNPGMLGLRLAAGDQPATTTAQPPGDPKSASDTPSILGVCGSVLNSLQYGANDGQLRDEFERDQTVIIYTDGLNLTDFAPADVPLDTAMKNGYCAMAKYYSIASAVCGN
jgi:predicted acylesterase/phospholipase RssA